MRVQGNMVCKAGAEDGESYKDSFVQRMGNFAKTSLRAAGAGVMTFIKKIQTEANEMLVRTAIEGARGGEAELEYRKEISRIAISLPTQDKAQTALEIADAIDRATYAIVKLFVCAICDPRATRARAVDCGTFIERQKQQMTLLTIVYHTSNSIFLLAIAKHCKEVCNPLRIAQVINAWYLLALKSELEAFTKLLQSEDRKPLEELAKKVDCLLNCPDSRPQQDG